MSQIWGEFADGLMDIEVKAAITLVKAVAKSWI